MVCMVFKGVYVLMVSVMSMVFMLFIAFMCHGVFSVHGVHGVFDVLLHYRTTGCSFNCLSMSLIIYITVPYSVHTTGCPF